MKVAVVRASTEEEGVLLLFRTSGRWIAQEGIDAKWICEMDMHMYAYAFLYSTA